MKLHVALALVFLWNTAPGSRAQSSTASSTDNIPAATSTAADAPLPPIRELMLDVERNQKRAEAERRDYTYHVHTVEDDFDSHENVKKTTVTDAESLEIQGVRVDKVVAKNGRPLTPDEAKKEDERIDKAVAKAKENRARNENKGRDTDAEGHDEISASRILELGSFSNPRRVQLNGRPTIVLDYAGDPRARTKNSFEGIFKDLAGQVWIDEQERMLVRGEGHFASDFKLGGGLLVDVHSGFRFDFQSTHINDEVWLPQRIEAEGSARMLLFMHVRGHVTITMSDFRKFRASSTILPGSNVLGPDGQPLPVQPETTAPPASPPDHP